MTRLRWTAAALCLVGSGPLLGQSSASLASRVSAVRDGTVEFTFPSRPDVCGDGRGSIWTNDNGYRGYICIHGPVRVTMGRADNQTVSVRSCVACAGRVADGAGDLGEVPAGEAARYLLDVARTLGGSNGDNAVSAATFADVADIAPDLARLVRDENATLPSRKTALFWLGQTDLSTKGLIGLDSELKSQVLRDQYVFVLSQRHDDASLDKLIDVARHDPDIDVRKKAMFWLAQSHEPKALAFFKEVLKP
jgi:HEAT repeat protein